MEDSEKFRVRYQPSDDFSCPVLACEFIGANPQKLFGHLRKWHQKDKFKIKCLHSVNCFHDKYFVTVSNLSYHIQKYHAQFFKVGERSEEPRSLVNAPYSGASAAASTTDACESIFDTQPGS